MLQANEIGFVNADEVAIGSRELNRRLEDIKFLIPAIVGMVPEEELFIFKKKADYGSVTVFLSRQIDGEACEWYMDVGRYPRTKHNEEHAAIQAVRFLYGGEGWYCYDKNAHPTLNRTTLPSMEQISLVYEHRQDFLDAMLVKFPSIRQRIKPIIHAARWMKT